MSKAHDPIELAVFNKRFAAIAHQMGVTLQRTACSPNIKERRDASCALFDARGELIAQAAHIPVHLGAMPMSTQAAIEAFDLAPGDTVILNDPFSGGTHLPDITLVTPVFLWGEDRPRFYVANRAHHADVGGSTPGSMPLSTHIDQEGLRLPPTLLIRGGVVDKNVLGALLAAVRTPAEREGDLAAQQAANHVGAERLRALCEEHGAERVCAVADELQDRAEILCRELLRALPTGRFTFTDYLDDDGAGTTDIPIRATVVLPGDGGMNIDFEGSAPQVHGCLNAVEAITQSACAYLLYCLLGPDIPHNGGALRPLKVQAPAGSITAAKAPAAVAGGNVETSQRMVDAVLGALAEALPDRIPAASCGSMNNLTIGGHDPERGPFAYYETIAGGAGAGPRWHGRSGVHTHMTNTQNTPIEALEHAYPLRVRSYRLRKNSGGSGRFRGGDGVERSVELLAPATLTLITERRVYAPWGLAGGGDGARGSNHLLRDGERIELEGKCEVDAQRGDVLIVETPGGGGWGT